jgi:hypothetical protein
MLNSVAGVLAKNSNLESFSWVLCSQHTSQHSI